MRRTKVPIHQALRTRRGWPPPEVPESEPPSRSNKPAATSRVARTSTSRRAALRTSEVRDRAGSCSNRKFVKRSTSRLGRGGARVRRRVCNGNPGDGATRARRRPPRPRGSANGHQRRTTSGSAAQRRSEQRQDRARLVPGRRPLNSPRTSASSPIARAAASDPADRRSAARRDSRPPCSVPRAVDAGRTRTARTPGATRWHKCRRTGEPGERTPLARRTAMS
jgi:hypothetical protein